MLALWFRYDFFLLLVMPPPSSLTDHVHFILMTCDMISPLYFLQQRKAIARQQGFSAYAPEDGGG